MIPQFSLSANYPSYFYHIQLVTAILHTLNGAKLHQLHHYCTVVYKHVLYETNFSFQWYEEVW